MQRYFILCFLLFSIKVILAQEQTKDPEFVCINSKKEVINFKEFMYSQLARYNYDLQPVKNLDTTCRNLTVFVRFVITEKGEIENIECTKNTPEELIPAYKTLVKSSEKYWTSKTINNQKVRSNYLILHIFNLSRGSYTPAQMDDGKWRVFNFMGVTFSDESDPKVREEIASAIRLPGLYFVYDKGLPLLAPPQKD